MSRFTIPVCHIDDIDHESSKGFEIGELNFFAVKRDGVITLFENNCPHLGVNLEFQEDQFLDADNFYIMCSTHGALFQSEDGKCVYGPCQGESLSPVEFEIIEQQLYISETATESA